MNKTKQRIIEAAIMLFNEFGYSNVSMQKLANHLKVSPGNLTYHYPKKADLMLAIYDQFRHEISLIVPPGKDNKPDLHHLDVQIRQFYIFQQRFLFFYLDLLEIERAYPELAERHYVHVRDQIQTILLGLKYNENLGLLKKEEDKAYHHLAEQMWFTTVFWPRQVRVRGVEDKLENLRTLMWQQIKPYLTDSGKKQVDNLLDTKQLQKSIFQS